MAEQCWRVQDGLGMPAECVLSIGVPFFNWKGDIRNYCCWRAVNLLEYGMKVVVRVFI